VAVNCGALPKDLVESELFGHRKGAFTGASEDRAGCFESADGGTLFLDELGELPLMVQVKLLRVLQEGQVRRVGDDQTRKVDVRIISATNKDLAVEIQDGRFREDLFHRLALGVLNLPALRERAGDLKLLVEDKLNKLQDNISRDGTRTVPSLTAGAMSVINQHSWPGNIRELFNALTRAVIWCDSDKVSRQEMSDSLLNMGRSDSLSVNDVPLGNGFKLDEFLRDAQERLIQRAQSTSSKQKEVAERLGISDSNLRQKLKKQNDKPA
jgi:DNA-binding NtrC family response regulator